MLASGLGSRANLYASSNRPSATSATYRPALVWAGQAIMQGKLVFNQSLSTCLSLNRFSKIAVPSAFPLVESILLEQGGERTMAGRSLSPYLLSVKSALLSPATVTGWVLVLAPSCHAVTV